MRLLPYTPPETQGSCTSEQGFCVLGWRVVRRGALLCAHPVCTIDRFGGSSVGAHCCAPTPFALSTCWRVVRRGALLCAHPVCTIDMLAG
ncbi:MAG: hypothetical protein NTZ05_16520, partial [Chloroflexi bacterium]|nr:hypothetical protein [Chloroflexota bacterium]